MGVKQRKGSKKTEKVEPDDNYDGDKKKGRDKKTKIDRRHGRRKKRVSTGKM